MVWTDLGDAVRAALIEQAPRLVEKTHCVTYHAFDCTRLKQLNHPTLLFSDRRSPTVAELVVSELARQISSAKLVQLEDAGHMPLCSRPALMLRWWRSL